MGFVTMALLNTIRNAAVASLMLRAPQGTLLGSFAVARRYVARACLKRKEKGTRQQRSMVQRRNVQRRGRVQAVRIDSGPFSASKDRRISGLSTAVITLFFTTWLTQSLERAWRLILGSMMASHIAFLISMLLFGLSCSVSLIFQRNEDL